MEPPPLPVVPGAASFIRWQRTGLVLALCAIAVSVGFILNRNEDISGGKPEQVGPNRMIELMARYAVGAKGLMQMSGQWQPALIEPMLADMGTLTQGDQDALRGMLLRSWLTEAWPTHEALSAFEQKDPDLRMDVATLRKLKTRQGEVEEMDWRLLLQRHGWLAEMARAQTRGAEHAARQVITQQGIGTAVVMIAAMMLGLTAAVGGLGLLILGFVRWRRGELRLTLGRCEQAEGGVLIEGFAIYLALFLLLPSLLHLSPVSLPRWAGYLIVTLAVVLGMFWPRLRGLNKAAWREMLGLHRGQGMWKEMGLGVLGWLASLPLLVLGMIAATWIVKLTGSHPTHPIVDDFAGNFSTKLAAVLLAAVWAPITEEIMFRGLLFPGLSAWLRWVAGIFMAAFIFAVIHPQGWAGVPAIMCLASAFSVLRLWRRSLIAPMTAHALNNGLLCLVMLLIF